LRFQQRIRVCEVLDIFHLSSYEIPVTKDAESDDIFHLSTYKIPVTKDAENA